VRQWMRDPEQAEAMRVNRENPRYLKGIKIHPGVEPVTDLLATLTPATCASSRCRPAPCARCWRPMPSGWRANCWSA
jgi:hypothetical protein